MWQRASEHHLVTNRSEAIDLAFHVLARTHEDKPDPRVGVPQLLQSREEKRHPILGLEGSPFWYRDRGA